MIETKPSTSETAYALSRVERISELLKKGAKDLGPNEDLATKLLEQSATMLATFQFKEIVKLPDMSKTYVFVSPLDTMPSVGKEEILFSEDRLGIPYLLVKTLRKPTEEKISHTEISFVPVHMKYEKPLISFWQANYEPGGKSDMEVMTIRVEDHDLPTLTYTAGNEEIQNERLPREKAFEKFLWPY